MVTAFFKLHHGINIPDDFQDYNLTLRQFVDKVSDLPKLSSADYLEHLQGIQFTLHEGLTSDEDDTDSVDVTNLRIH